MFLMASRSVIKRLVRKRRGHRKEISSRLSVDARELRGQAMRLN